MSYIRSQSPSAPVVAPFAAYNAATTLGSDCGDQRHRKRPRFGIPRNTSVGSDHVSHMWGRLVQHLLHLLESKSATAVRTVGQSDPSGTCTPSCFDGDQKQTGALPPLVSFAVSHGVKTLEFTPMICS